MKLLFLDIDGVLNSVRSAVAYDGYPHPEREDKFDDVAVKLIKQLCVKTNCFIILSSTWRIGIPNMILFGKKLDLPIIDRTPRKMSATRGEEIAMYLSEAKDVEKYAIIDDDSDMLKEQIPFFVQTDNRNGISYENYLALLKLLE